MTARTPRHDEPGDFWRLARVVEVTGLSKTTIYRRIKVLTFPDSRSYQGSSGVFWLATDIREWQRRELSSRAGEL
jgi:predicted DNA-binding transcriptional regulator AlpA